MDYLRQFIIPFKGLKEGLHQFDFEIDEKFFDYFEYAEIKNGKVNVHLEMEKEERLLVLNFSLDGIMNVPCDRCNEPMDLPIHGKEKLIVKFGAGYEEESEDVQIIPEEDNQVDVSPFIYEYIQLLLPVRRVHGEDPNGVPLCDPEIIRKLESKPVSEETDPRWDALKKLKTKN
ncbi:MAG: DUF177 domain-containing protein [Bacteroidota bacterium]|nr:DUF177 domain-containing protein [Bacteroidota bacterium]